MTNAQPKLDTDPRRTAWKPFSAMCWKLAGDPVLVPFKDGEPDWEGTARDTITKIAHWSDIEEADIPRLAILTDSFARFIGNGDDASIVTLWRDGTPDVRQIGGKPNEAALDLVMDAITGNQQIRTTFEKLGDRLDVEIEAKKVAREAANDNEPAGFDERLIPYAEAYGGEIRGTTLFSATVGKRAGQISFLHNGAAWFYHTDGAHKVELPTGKETRLRTISASEWEGRPIPPRPWYVEGLIPSRNVTLLSGDGGTGKSLVSMQIAVAGATGGETLGIMPHAGRVLYIAAEDEQDELHRRLADILAHAGKSFADLGDRLLIAPLAGKDAELACLGDKNRMMMTALANELDDLLKSYRPRLLVLDTSADLFGGSEIDRVHVRFFVSALRGAAMEHDLAVLLLSHPSVAGMASGSGISGSTAWNNSVRSRLYLTAAKDDDDGRLLSTVKSNYGRKGGALKLRWQDGAFALDDGKPSIASGLLNKRHDEVFLKLLSAINRTGQRCASSRGVNYAPTLMAGHPDADGIGKPQFESAMQRLLANSTVKVVWEGPPSKPRQRLIISAEDFGPGRDNED